MEKNLSKLHLLFMLTLSNWMPDQPLPLTGCSGIHPLFLNTVSLDILLKVSKMIINLELRKYFKELSLVSTLYKGAI